MNIPKEAIEKAIGADWQPDVFKGADTVFFSKSEESQGYNFWLDEPETFFVSDADIALDPTFWQTLGKALGWPEYAPICHRCNNIRKERYDLSCSADGHCDLVGYDHKRVAPWNAHRFYDLILQGKDTADYWAELLK